MKNKLKLNKQELVDARDWLLDCCVTDDDVEFIEQATGLEIERLVQKFHSGGVEGFLFSYGPNYEREVS